MRYFVMNRFWYIIISLSFTLICYPISEIYLYYNYDKYSNYDEQRKNYIKKNFIKSNILKYLSIATLPISPLIFISVTGFNDVIWFLASLYTAGDTIALFINIKLSKATKYHHVITTLLSFINLFIDWSNAGTVPKLMAVYMISSCYTYNVNKCLAFRFLENREKEKENKKNAFIVYISSCIVNWLIHLCVFIYKLNDLTVFMYFYYFLVVIIAYDDLILLKWLCS